MTLFTFIVTPVIFKSYGRDTAGEIVGRLFPSYFLFTIAVSASAWVLFFISFPERNSARYTVSLVLLSFSVVTALYVYFRLYPQARQEKEKVDSFESGAPDSPARSRFRRLHARSAILNLFMIAEGMVLLILNLGTRR